MKPEWVETVERARAGDVDAQGSLLRQFAPLVRATAIRLVARDDVDDVVQETFTVAIAQLSSLRTCEAFPAWLRLIARKQAHRHRHASRETTALAEVDRVDDTVDPADVATTRELAAIVRVAMTSARDSDRYLLELRYLAGWNNAELAEHLGISHGALRKRLHDARKRLRPHVELLNPKETTMTDFDAVLGAIHGPDLEVAEPSRLGPPPDERTVTGLKIIDTIAPIRRGGTIEMTGRQGTGQVVLALELLGRLGRSTSDIACVAVGMAGATIGSQPDLGHLVTDDDVATPAMVILWSDPDQVPAAAEAARRVAAGLAHTGRDVALLIDGPTLDLLDPVAVRTYAGLAEVGSVTVVALRPVIRAEDTPPPLELDTTLVFSIELLALGIFPAVDPSSSTSVLPASEAARTIRAELRHAAEVRSWFHQDLFVASEFTGRSGTWVEPSDADAQLRALVR